MGVHTYIAPTRFQDSSYIGSYIHGEPGFMEGSFGGAVGEIDARSQELRGFKPPRTGARSLGTLCPDLGSVPVFSCLFLRFIKWHRSLLIATALRMSARPQIERMIFLIIPFLDIKLSLARLRNYSSFLASQYVEHSGTLGSKNRIPSSCKIIRKEQQNKKRQGKEIKRRKKRKRVK
jgi:hypothetical protein